MPAFVIIIAIARRPDIFRMLLLRFGGFHCASRALLSTYDAVSSFEDAVYGRH
jgi:hypothetical protein